jgi:bacteriorhodopsin
MGSNLGWTPIDVEWLRSNPMVAGRNRQVFYARYIDWVITTPLLLLDLLLTAGMPWPTILWVIGIDEIMIVTGLIGALVKSRYKWGFYAFGCAAMFYIFYELAFTARRHALHLGRDVHRCFVTCGVLTLVLWLAYPICWGLSEGGNVISPDGESIFYGVLDLLAKPVFSAALIFGHWNIAPSRLGLQIKEFGDQGLSDAEREKFGMPPAAQGVTNGNTDGVQIDPDVNGSRHT